MLSTVMQKDALKAKSVYSHHREMTQLNKPREIARPKLQSVCDSNSMHLKRCEHSLTTYSKVSLPIS